MRCHGCGAALSMPDDLALTVDCPFCGIAVELPDRGRREAALRQHQDRIRDVARREEDEQKKAIAARRAAEEERRERRAGRLGRLWYGVLGLIGPAIAVWFIFDIPARFLGSTGADRVEAWAASRRAAGCTELVAPTVDYLAGDAIVVPLAPGTDCVEVYAAGGTGHSQLDLAIMSASGRELERPPSGRDVQANTCQAAREPRRAEISPGPAAKGRVTHAAFTCPTQSPSTR